MRKLVENLLDHRLCRLYSLVWMAIIFYLSSLPDIPGPDIFSAQDKVGHFVVFAVLGLLVARSLGPWHGGLNWKRAVAVIIIVAGYGASDELHQMFVPGRDASLLDLVFDTCGGIFSAALMHEYLHSRWLQDTTH